MDGCRGRDSCFRGPTGWPLPEEKEGGREGGKKGEREGKLSEWEERKGEKE